VIVGWAAYFLPRQSTIINGLTIGIPAFFLALAPNTQRYVPGFIKRVLRFAIPAGVIVAAAVVVAYALAHAEDVELRQARTTATIVLMILGLYVLAILARPYTPYRLALLLAMIGMFLGALLIPFFQDFFKLELPGTNILLQGLACAAAGCVGLELVTQAERRWSAVRAADRTGSTASPAS
jgi:cation-transporting ATPase E